MKSSRRGTSTFFTFIIPIYENMSITKSELPKDNQNVGPINMKVTSNNGLWIRQEPNTSSAGLKVINSNEIVLSVQRIGNWHKVITKDGLIGYMSGNYLVQVIDETNCNYNAIIKTNDGNGCNVRIGPSIKFDKIMALSDETTITVINEGTYNNIDGYNWCRIKMSDGRQAFLPSNYIKKR